MKRLLTTAATVLVLSTAAQADSMFMDKPFDQAVDLYASELMGMRVYATETDVNADTRIAKGGEKDWDDIGEIDDIVLTRDGQVQSVIVGVGGFLGIGEKDVAIDMSQLKFVHEEGDDNDFFLVVNANAAALKDAPAYDRHAGMAVKDMTMADKAKAAADTDKAMPDKDKMAADTDKAMPDKDKMAADDRPMLTAPAVEREGYAPVQVADLSTEDLTGARVYGANDEDVGEISKLLVTDDGRIDRAVIDVGGFLGIGEHTIAVTFDELQIVRNKDGSDVRVYIDSTKEALKNQPEYKG